MSMNIYRVSIGDGASRWNTDSSGSDHMSPAGSTTGLVQGGLGRPEDDAGQEEVFSRAEVEGGRANDKARGAA